MKTVVLLGTQPQSFSRLTDEIETLIRDEKLLGEVVIQSGHTVVSSELEQLAEVTPFLSKEKYDEVIASADLVITHGGAGSMFDALNRNKQVIAIPRLTKYEEHVDDHQIELVEKLKQLQYIVSEATVEKSLAILEMATLLQYRDNKDKVREIIKKNIGLTL